MKIWQVTYEIYSGELRHERSEFYTSKRKAFESVNHHPLYTVEEIPTETSLKNYYLGTSLYYKENREATVKISQETVY